MSFAATLALISAYERGIPWMRAGADTSRGARVALWGGREIVALIVVSLAAGTATMPYVGFHFHRLGPYGVVANLLAMPIVSAFVMPSGLLALVAMPFGLDAPLWRLMGVGIEWMIWVAQFVASFPGAVGRIVAFGTGPLLLCTAGLLLLCLLRSPLRWSGTITILAASLWAFHAPVPDVYVGDRGDVVAVRGASGRLAVMRTVAMLANEAADAVTQGIASAHDVDLAMQKGVNYPHGPLTWADTIGVARVRDVLANLAAHYGEDRYRTSPLIARRCASGTPLAG